MWSPPGGGSTIGKRIPDPPRAVVEAATYEEANQRSRTLIGEGISLQTFALTKKIMEVESCRVDAGATLRPAGSVDPSRMV
jgi:predicted RNase H-like nuclease